ncbi:MAG TPA: PEP-utilizing enzyme [Amycolatopsis sp.]|nr:PEP-utilizing enzyme [Amycolatopsis sp.]
MGELFDPVRGTSEPGRLWSITNVSEATPDILSPLCWSVWGRGLEEGVLWSMYSFGVVARREIFMSDNPNDLKTAAIYGRQAFNVDAVRRMVAPMPGVDPDDLERDIMGAAREGVPKEPARPWRIPIILAKMPWAMLRSGGELRAAYEDIRQWWRTEVFEAGRDGKHATARPIDRLREARDRFQRIFGIHCKVRLQLQAVQSALHDAAVKAGDISLATRAFSGQGNVREVGMAEDLWRLAQGELTEDEFLAEYGFHGPNEGNVYTRSWREEPAPLRTMARSMAARQAYVSPRVREEQAGKAGAEAQAELLNATSALGRPALRFILGRARNIVRNNEIGKAGYLMTLDGCRAAARDLGREEVAGGRLGEVDDVFFLTLEELGQLVAGELDNAAELVSYRRGTREEYKRMKLPSSFEGMPEVLTEPHHAAGPADGSVDPITGAASGGGQVKGRARVVLDPNEDVELDAGDILVCRFTDPSWAPLFTLAEALVIDLGGAASHGALVAREMGIPYVIGTGDGTARIQDGDTILVDGQANSVRVVERAPGFTEV